MREKTELIGQVLNDRYKILEELHRGATSTFYKAHHDLMERTVAIKILNKIHDPIEVKRFQQEAQCASRLQHPGIVTVFDFGFEDQKLPYLVMDFINGRTLDTVLLNEGPLSPERFRALFFKLCSAMAHVHERRIVHRNLKPSNFMIYKDANGNQFPEIIDFHLAEYLLPLSELIPSLTLPGEIVGTPAYMSPEQCLGDRITERSDIYSMGCAMYFALTNRPPFHASTSVDTMQMQIHLEPPKGKLPEEFEPIIWKAIEKRPENRYQTMAELGELLGGRPVEKNINTWSAD